MDISNYLDLVKENDIENDVGIICFKDGTSTWTKRSAIIAFILSELRRTFGYTQEYIANKLNIAQNQYSRYESGKNLPSIETLIRISIIYNVSLNYLCGIDIDNYNYAYEKSLLTYSNDKEKIKNDLFINQLQLIYSKLYGVLYIDAD